MQLPTKTRSKKPLFITITVILLLLLGGLYALYKAGYIKLPGANSEQTNADNQKPREAVSEGSTFPIPDDIPQESIKDYKLITENEQYKIRFDEKSNSYLITLYAIINSPDQYSMYQDQMREYKQNALDYLKDTGKDVKTLEIKYEPEEAAQL